MKKTKSVLYFLGCYARHTPLYLLLYLAQTVANALLYVLNSIYLLKLAFDAFETRPAFSVILAQLLAVAAFNLLMLAFGHWFTHVYAPQKELRVRQVIQHAVFDQAARLDLRRYDDETFYDAYILALRSADTLGQSLLQGVGDCLYNVTAIASILTILLSIDIWVVCLILCAVGISFGIDLLLSKKEAARDFAALPLQRKLAYYERVHYLPDHIEEVKSLPDADFLTRAHQQAAAACGQLHRQKSRPMVRLYALKGLCQSLLTSFGIYFLLVYKLAVERSILLGDLSAALNSVWRLSDRLNQIIGSITGLYKQSLYAARMREFLQLQPDARLTAGSRPVPDKAAVLQLKGLSFSYDGRRRILDGIDLTIAPGQRIAVVGQNGSGKSTLIKVLMGLYPSSGQVFLDGHPLEEYDRNALRRYFHGLFQDFQIYAVTLRENLCMDLPESALGTDARRLQQALQQVGLARRTAAMPDGLDTVILQEYDDAAQNLSGGEKQKVALARVLLCPACVIVLDEPSSALDPVGEQQFNDLLLSAFTDRTVIFISHRFFATRHADRIYLLHGGRLTENGTHSQLMALQGEYARMYQLQKEKYKL